MGPVVTINSATLVNKGLEVIEAHLLFDIPFERIEVVVHPQSVVHSMVEFVDGSTLAQACPPDMRLPIALGLAWPDRVEGASRPCDWTTATSWEFSPLDEEAFPARGPGKAGGRGRRVLPGGLQRSQRGVRGRVPDGRLPFLDIVDTIERVVDEWSTQPAERFAALLDVRDTELRRRAWARNRAHEVLGPAGSETLVP